MLYDLNEPFLSHNKDNELDDEQVEKRIAEKLREGFITKVYGIIAYQILVTSLIVYLGLVNTWFQEVILKSKFFLGLNIIITITCLFLPMFSPKLLQKMPSNYIILTAFTISFSCIISMETSKYTVKSVMSALFLTLATVLTLSYYAWKTKTDFTVHSGTLLVCLVLLIFSSFIFLVLRIPFSNLIIMYGSLVLCCIYLIYDTQLLIGRRGRKFSEDDYILAAFSLYLDIIVLFLQILKIFGDKKSSTTKEEV
jgi:FtsH-binding integral membrane protein